jgi:hypothetical protein
MRTRNQDPSKFDKTATQCRHWYSRPSVRQTSDGSTKSLQSGEIRMPKDFETVRAAARANQASLEGQSQIQKLFSSIGTRWKGLTVGKGRQTFANRPFDVILPETAFVSVLTKTDVKWRASGESFKCAWKPGTSVFLKRGYELKEVLCSVAEYDIVGVSLEDSKIVELLHDDFRPTRQKFLDHVITPNDPMSGLVNVMLTEARSGSPAGSLCSSGS